ncbi:MAG: T9SS type A sorting domain-containing protein, partial [Bacteroidota bacterium]
MFKYDDTTWQSPSWENSWSINPGQSGWIGNYFPVSATTGGKIEMVKYYFVNDPNHGLDWLSIDFFDPSHNLLGSTNRFFVPSDGWDSIAVNNVSFSGPFYAMVHWDHTIAPTNRLGYDENGPYASQDPEAYFDGTTWSKLSDPANGGNPGVCGIRVLALVEEKPNDNPVSGYNVYRSQDLVNYPYPPLIYTKLNTAVISSTSYSDVHPAKSEPGCIWKYFVKAVFNNSVDNTFLCDASNDTITVNWPETGFKTPDTKEVLVYPNPANDQVKIESTSMINSVELMNFIGQIVYSNAIVGKTTMQFDVSTLVPGI